MNKVDYLEKELLRLLAWISASDTRVSFVLPLSTAMLGVLAVLAPCIDDWSVLSAISTSFSALFLVLSIGCLALATFPRTDGPKGSMIFFSGINDKELEQYRISVGALDEQGYIYDLINQCHINAQIAFKKYFWVKHSQQSLFISSAPWFISVYLLYGMQ
jgi:hypothetical protein